MPALTTEHFTLQTARAVAVNEGNGRTALYIGALSSTLVALALVAHRPPLGHLFHVVALTVGPAVFFLGLVTYVRVLQSSIEDILYARAINRIRHYYTELDPTRAHYFLLSGRDDVRGALANMCLRDSWTQFLFTLPSAVAVINALLAGVTVGLGARTAAGGPGGAGGRARPRDAAAGHGAGRDRLGDHGPGPAPHLPGAQVRRHEGARRGGLPLGATAPGAGWRADRPPAAGLPVGGQGPVDQRLRRAQVAGRVEGRLDPGRAQPAGDLPRLQQGGAQGA